MPILASACLIYIVDMIILRNRWFPGKKYVAFAFFYFIFVRRGTKLTDNIIRHETIHWHQEVELLFIGNYLLYSFEYLIRIIRECQKCHCFWPNKKIIDTAYRNISFEREAYENEYNKTYLKHRRPYSWVKYIKKH